MKVIAHALACLLLVPLTALRAAEPAFAIRGTLPWHNFLSGPSAWNESDYRAYLDDLAAKGLNFVAFHCYTGGEERYAPYVEPLIRVKYRDVLPEAGFDTSLTARWGYRPLGVREFAYGTERLFNLPQGAQAFGADCAVTAISNEDRYRQAQALMRKVIGMAHERGIQVAMGFEFGIHPPELASIVPPESRIAGALVPDPTHPANIGILQATVEDVLAAYPGIDWVWLWLHEHSHLVAPPELTGRFGEFYQREKANFSSAPNGHDVFTGVWALAQIRQVHAYLARRSPTTRLVIGGWGALLPVMPGLDRGLPTDIVFSCLSDSPVLAEVAKHRPTWAVPWLEYDGWLWHLQLQAAAVSKQVEAAHAAKLSGVVGIHWRTEVPAGELPQQVAAARRELAKAPVEELFRTFARRVRSRGELGELSSLNQKLWLQYRELQRFLEVTGTTYYVSQSSGNDAWDGLAASHDGTHGPWKSLAKASQTYSPGDSIRLKCGDTWANDTLRPTGSGEPDNPITIATYGTGSKPILDGLDEARGRMGIHLKDEAGYRIEGLEFTRCQTGIYAEYSAGALYRKGLRIENCYFHDSQLYQHYEDYPKRKIGLGICLFSHECDQKIVMSDITIRNCEFRRLASGIWTNSPDNYNKAADNIWNFANLVIEGCLFEECRQWPLG